MEYFIGLKRDSKSKEWRWISDNSTVNATRGKFPWAKGEPSGDGKCAVMYKDYLENYGLFDDLSCIVKLRVTGYICESSVNSNHQEGMFYKTLRFLLRLPGPTSKSGCFNFQAVLLSLSSLNDLSF